MPGDPDFIPDEEFIPNAKIPASKTVTHAPSAIQKSDSEWVDKDPEFIPDHEFVSNEDKYGSATQTAIGAAEKFGQGLIGPVAPWLEVKSGLTTPEDIRLRTETAGGLGTAAEMAGFGAGALLGSSEGAVLGKFALAPLLGKLGEGAAAVAGLGKATGVGAKLAAGAVKGATEFAALGGGEELTRLIEKDPNQTAANAAAHVGMSAVLGTAMGAGFAAVPQMWRATVGPSVENILGKIKADWGFGNPLPSDEHIIAPKLKQALSILGGVSKENIEAYGANREAIMAAPEFNDVYAHVLDQLTDLQENIAVKRLSVDSAKSRFADFLKEQKLSLKQAGYDAGAADSLAQEALKQAQVRVAQGLQENAIQAAPKAFSAVQKLKDNAISMSQSARDILDKTPGELSLKTVFEAVRPMQDKLYSEGFPSMAEELGKQMDVFAHQYGENISYSNAKSMVQGLQKRGKWQFGANEMSNGLSPYFNQLSGIMNAELKAAVPAYERAMKPTAAAFDLLSKLDKYGTPESSVKGALGLKNAANYTNELPLLRSLEEKTGIRFTDQLDQYANPVVRDSMVKALPEYGKALRAAEAIQHLKDPEVRAALEKAPYLSSSYKQLKNAQEALETKLLEKEKLPGLTRATLEGKMKAAASGRSKYARDVLENVKGMEGMEGMEGMSIPEILDLINIREAFEKGATNGSRNVNLWSHMVGGLSGVISALGGGGLLGTAAGSAGGAYIGGLLDKEGPAIVKNILDKYLTKYGDLPKVMGASPEATRAGLIHFLDKDAPVDAKAFKSTVNYLQDAKKGKGLLERGAKAIFDGSKVFPQQFLIDKDKTEKLDKRSKHLQDNPQKMIDIGGGLGTYLPEHGMALTQAAQRSVSLINKNRPNTKIGALFDDPVDPTKQQINEYHRGLQIAQQPLVIFNRIKDNTLLPQDLQILNALHPEYMGHMKQSVVNAMMDHKSSGGSIPFSMRQGLSLFIGQDLDSSFAPANIVAAQTTFVAQKNNGPQGTEKGSPNKLDKMANRYQTASQGAQARRIEGKS